MTALLKLPEYRSHKVVQAAKIESIALDLSAFTIVNDGQPVLVVPAEGMFARYVPKTGDYYIVYRDGYTSISPASEFEAGYRELEPPPEPVVPLPPKEVAPLLMSRANPEGWKLEELLDKAALEIETLKTPLIRDDPRTVAQAVVYNNGKICALLTEAARLQRDSYRMLAQIGPNQGPLGTPRIGTGS